MTRTSAYPTITTPTPGLELTLEFLRARRAQNLSWMSLAEQSFTSMADMQKTAGATGAGLARLWRAQAAMIRDTASVYRSVTTHLAR
jgi:hypothetical protein